MSVRTSTIHFLQAEGVADFPARAGVGVRAVHDRHQPIGPVDPTDIGREDASPVLAGFLFLRQEHLVAGCPEGGGDFGVPGALGRREQRTGEIELHGREYRGVQPVRARPRNAIRPNRVALDGVELPDATVPA